MTFIEGASIVAGLGIGYWLVSVFTRDPDQHDLDPSVDAEKPTPGFDASAPWYEVLGVSEWASEEEVTAAWQAKQAQYHPDKVAAMGPEFRELAERKLAAIEQAYQDAMRQR
ncbi:MAG: J domain-containing protein [Thermomonas sp.]|uniref:J domain-containing protein n=1 Tax=Thermomonas sp. TaxID=1971895 RepID=UPI0039E4D464